MPRNAHDRRRINRPEEINLNLPSVLQMLSVLRSNASQYAAYDFQFLENFFINFSNHMNDHVRTQAQLRRIENFIPESTLTYFAKSLCYLKLKSYRQAMNAIEEALQLEPRNASYHNLKGIIHAAIADVENKPEHFNQAHICFNKAIQIDSESASYHRNKAMILWKHYKNYSAALECYDRAIQTASSETEKAACYFEKAEILQMRPAASSYEKRIQREVAIDLLLHAIRLNPNDAIYYHSLAALYEQLGRNKEAMDAIDKAVELEPREPLYREAQRSIHAPFEKTDHQHEKTEKYDQRWHEKIVKKNEQVKEENAKYSQRHNELRRRLLALPEEGHTTEEYVQTSDATRLEVPLLGSLKAAYQWGSNSAYVLFDGLIQQLRSFSRDTVASCPSYFAQGTQRSATYHRAGFFNTSSLNASGGQVTQVPLHLTR